jgi:hypothetical protein
VLIPPGEYRLTSVLNLDRSDVVLRGGGPRRTRLRLDSREPIPAIRWGRIWPTYQPRAWDVVGGVPKGATEVRVSAMDGRDIAPGDVLQIDQEDEPWVWLFDGRFRKRQPESDANGPGTGAAPFAGVKDPGGPWRSVGQQMEVVETRAEGATTVLRLAGPAHVAFDALRRPQLFHTGTARPGRPGVRYSGIEDLAITGGNQDNVTGMNLAFCWMRNVESDGDRATGPGMAGHHVNLVHAYRCEIRDSTFHHARFINQGGTAYGVSIANQSSDNLVENNVVVHLNKPILMNASGGGNVVAYNYVDGAYSVEYPGWQESSIDGNHQTFSHHDLFEGNWTVNIGSDSTHGNAGWQTFFRNYATGANDAAPAKDRGNVRAVGIDGHNRDHNVVGNVLLRPGLEANGRQAVYECLAPGPCMLAPAAYRLGANVGPYDGFDDGTARRTLFRHGNFDLASGRVIWDPGHPSRCLPDSLYLTRKPAFFGDLPWPWVNPLGRTAAERVGVLPAKARHEAGRLVGAVRAPPGDGCGDGGDVRIDRSVGDAPD